MKIVHTIRELRSDLQKEREAGKSIGLVPTMGALHQGHLSLVQQSIDENEVTVVSIFVNPTQFNDPNDLKKYPRTLAEDCQLLEKVGCTYVFAPSAKEVYPEPDTRQFTFTPLDTVMEGPRRPGHFNGVAQIVSKLFTYVEPQKAYFGEKDFQQLAIIRELIKQLGLDIKIIGCPIRRDTDGLALSSRNNLLSPEERQQAVNISKSLFKSTEYAHTHTLQETQQFVKECIKQAQGLELEYYEIIDGETLQPVQQWNDSPYVVGCITAHCGKVRLIDNIKYEIQSQT